MLARTEFHQVLRNSKLSTSSWYSLTLQELIKLLTNIGFGVGVTRGWFFIIRAEGLDTECWHLARLPSSTCFTGKHNVEVKWFSYPNGLIPTFCHQIFLGKLVWEWIGNSTSIHINPMSIQFNKLVILKLRLTAYTLSATTIKCRYNSEHFRRWNISIHFYLAPCSLSLKSSAKNSLSSNSRWSIGMETASIMCLLRYSLSLAFWIGTFLHVGLVNRTTLFWNFLPDVPAPLDNINTEMSLVVISWCNLLLKKYSYNKIDVALMAVSHKSGCIKHITKNLIVKKLNSVAYWPLTTISNSSIMYTLKHFLNSQYFKLCLWNNVQRQ